MAVAYEQAHAFRQLAVNASTWTDIVGLAALPLNCNQVIVLNLSAVIVYYRSDPGNANSQVPINPGQGLQIGASRGSSPFLFQAGSANPVGSLLSSSGSVNVTIESLQ